MRNEFEAAPDTGLIPKGFSRIVNVVYTVVVVGVIGTLLIELWALAWVLLAVTVCGTILLTTPLWALVYVVCGYLYCAVWWAGDDGYVKWPQYYTTPGSHSTSFKVPHLTCPPNHPLANLGHVVVWSGCGQLLCGLVMLVLGPVDSIIRTLFLAMVWAVTAWHDLLVFNIVIRLKARIPISNSFLAVRIRGPGLSAVTTRQITQESALLVVHARLENYELSYYRTAMNWLIAGPDRSWRSFFSGYQTAAEKQGLVLGTNTHFEKRLGGLSGVVTLKKALADAIKVREQRSLLVPNTIHSVGMTKANYDEFVGRVTALVKYFGEQRMQRWLIAPETNTDAKGKKNQQRQNKNLLAPPQSDTVDMWRAGRWDKLADKMIRECFGYDFTTSLEEKDMTQTLSIQHLDLSGYTDMILRAAPRHGLDKAVVVKDDTPEVARVQYITYTPPKHHIDWAVTQTQNLQVVSDDGVLDRDVLRYLRSELVYLAILGPFIRPKPEVTTAVAPPGYSAGPVRAWVNQPANTIADEKGLTNVYQVDHENREALIQLQPQTGRYTTDSASSSDDATLMLV